MALSAQERLKLMTEQVSSANELADIYGRLGSIISEQNKSLSNNLNSQKEVIRLKLQENTISRSIKKLSKEIDEITQQLTANGRNLTRQERSKLKTLEKQKQEYDKILTNTRNERKLLQENSDILKATFNSVAKGIGDWVRTEFSIRNIWNYLQDIDGAIRKTQLSLGVSGEKAKMMRTQFENSINAAQNLGVTAKDLMELQIGITDITGKATAFREADLLAMAQLVKGTGLQNGEASNLLGTFENLGLSIESSRDILQGSINTTAKLGLSSNAVFKKVIANADKLSTYRFDKGVKGLIEMAQAAEKFKFSMEGALAMGDKFRTLDGLLEAGASLRVLGGEFAKMDEFKLSFLARNKPQEFLVEVSKLTKGMATLNKETGTFDIDDVGMDRLRAASESANVPLKDLVETTRAFNQMEFAKKQILVGTAADKEMIAKLATFKPGSMMGFIKINGNEVELNKLTLTQIKLYENEQKTLAKRAEESQNANERFNNTVQQLKANLVPLLGYINKGLDKFNSLVNSFRDGTGALQASALLIPIGGLLLGTMGGGIILGLIKGIAMLVGSGLGKLFGAMGVGAGGGMNAAQMLASGKGSMYTLVGIGVAAMGVGAGFYFASKGVAALAESFKGLNSDQIGGIKVAVSALAVSLVGITALAIPLQNATGVLLRFGAAVGIIGGAIGLAGYGIGKAAEGFNNVKKEIKFEGLEGITNANFDNLDKLKVLQNFKQSDVDRMEEMFDILNKINAIDTSKLDSLQKAFSNMSFKVELEGNPTINNNITVDIDGEKFYRNVRKIVTIHSNKSAVEPKAS